MIDRIWVGPEAEGKEAQGVETVFVEAEALDAQDIRAVAEIARREGVGRVYFGANRKTPAVACNPEQWYGAVRQLSAHCKVVFEIEASALCRFIPVADAAIVVVRVDAPNTAFPKLSSLANLRLKIDNHKDVCGVSGELWYNSLCELSDGKYKNDKEIKI